MNELIGTLIALLSLAIGVKYLTHRETQKALATAQSVEQERQARIARALETRDQSANARYVARAQAIKVDLETSASSPEDKLDDLFAEADALRAKLKP